MANIKSAFTDIASFDGNPEILNFFEQQIEEIIQINKWPQNIALTFLKQKISGQALSLYINNSDCLNATTIAEVFQIFKNHFLRKPHSAYIQDFQKINFNPDIDHFTSFINKLNSLAIKVYPNLALDALNQIKYIKLLEVVPKKYKLQILEKSITTYQDAVSLVSHITSVEEECSFNPQASTSTASNPTVSNSVAVIDNDTHNSNHPQQPIYQANSETNFLSDRFLEPGTRFSRTRHRRPVNFNHRSAIQCRKFQNHPRRPSPCQFCNRHGHIAVNCFKLQAMISQNNRSVSSHSRRPFKHRFQHSTRANPSFHWNRDETRHAPLPARHHSFKSKFEHSAPSFPQSQASSSSDRHSAGRDKQH